MLKVQRELPPGSAELRSAFTKASSSNNSEAEHGHSRRQARFFASSYPRPIELLRYVWGVRHATSTPQGSFEAMKKYRPFHLWIEDGTPNTIFRWLLDEKYHQPTLEGCLFRQKHARNRPKVGRWPSKLQRHKALQCNTKNLVLLELG